MQRAKSQFPLSAATLLQSRLCALLGLNEVASVLHSTHAVAVASAGWYIRGPGAVISPSNKFRMQILRKPISVAGGLHSRVEHY